MEPQAFYSVELPRARAYSTGAGNEAAAARPTRDEIRAQRGLEYGRSSHEPPLRSSCSIMSAAGAQSAASSQLRGSLSEHTSPGRRSAQGQQASQGPRPASLCADHQPEVSHMELDARQQRLMKMRAENESIHLEAINMLRKSSFHCRVLGARQTGKRTIVICFVKLLNEFKLAADEYKKEKMLTKLVECSERLHELTSRQEEQEELQRQQQLDDEHTHNRKRRTSRLNSWLPGGERVRSLLNLAPVNKRRLHSAANLWANQEARPGDRSPLAGGQHQMVLLSPAEVDGSAPDKSTGQQQAQRRHTTIEPPSSEFAEATNRFARLSASSRYLNVEMQPGARLLACTNNKSDTNINYQATANSESRAERSHRNPATSHQLQVPSLEPAALRKNSDPTNCRSQPQPISRRDRTSSCTPHTDRRQSSQSPGSVFLSAADCSDRLAPNSRNISSTNWQRRHTALPTEVCRRGASQHRPSFNADTTDEPNLAGQPRASRPAPRQSICLSKRSRRILLSLKELNRRKFAIKFSTRRQISETYEEQLRPDSSTPADKSTAERPRRSRRRSILLQLVQTIALPDSFLVVYSISDRDSFEYAESLIKQLRAGQRDVPMPIILVANKSDLERNREVKSDDGRHLARSYACKFIEISCTIGFNLDTLLVGLRTQLVLRHHVILSSILRPGFRYKPVYSKTQSEAKKATRMEKSGLDGPQRNRANEAGTQKTGGKVNKLANTDNILMRFYKRYVIDSYVHSSYDCDNFSKL